MVKPLTVYKASAGSGKTFTLTVAYLRLLMENPTSYRNILAVTFTNKATEEMKMRILSQLYGIWQGLPESESYLQQLKALTAMTEEQIRQRAEEALKQLMHNYDDFRVETIDTFFQSVMRNLARELDLTANLRVELNDTDVEEAAVDSLIDSLKSNDKVLRWIMSYIMENISDDKSWNIISRVKQFGRTIFRDYYKLNSDAINERLGEKGFFEAYTQQLRQIRQQALEKMKAYHDEFIDITESNAIDIDRDIAYGRKGVAGFFLKLDGTSFSKDIEGKRVAECMEDPAKWYAKKSERPQEIHCLAEEQLIPLLRRAMADRPRQWRLYKSADLTLQHLNQLRLLESIEQKVKDMNNEANRFLLSDTQQLLHSLIKDSDSPFVFEKIGTRLEHIMIDEFQDTSTVQWHNFKVLLMECMSHRDSKNLIVGDVKQSIYRWRSGDWRLLNNIHEEIPHSNETTDIKSLDTNYRSEERIVTFNNAFFQEACRQEYKELEENCQDEAQQLSHAYDDVKQKVAKKGHSNGMVTVRLLPGDKYQQQTLDTVTNTIGSLMQQGVATKDIAILLRSNSNIPIIADYLSNEIPNVNIVSDEAFRLDSAVSVELLVNALHLLTHPDDQIAKATIVKIYQRKVVQQGMHDASDEDLLIKGTDMDSMLPEEYTQQREELLRMPLYELTERLYAIFQLERLNHESEYICAFYDQLNKFTQDNSSDIDTFIKEWETTIGRKTIQSTMTDGIRILSIHKSKGLEFDHVIIPFCDWKMEHADILWCQPKEAPFDELPIVPIDFSSKQMKGTIYEQDYYSEHLQTTVDNLNLLYVAFTRAAKSLTVIGRRGATSGRSKTIENVLPLLDIPESTLDGTEDNDAPMVFTYGELTPTTADSTHGKAVTRNVFLQPVEPETMRLRAFETKASFRQSNKSRDFIEGEQEENNELSYIKTGSILHNIFSTIRTTADIDDALKQLQFEGVLYNDEVTYEKISTMLRKRLESKRIRDWFSDRWTLHNECTILTVDKDGKMLERRPDRVMTDGKETHVVDFKFGKQKPEYHDQVREYMQLLRDMGMPEVKGWLWYVYSNKVEEVHSS